MLDVVPLAPIPVWYALTAGAGICISCGVWVYLIRRGVGGRRTDPRLPLIYGSALLGAIIGAKISFLVAEGFSRELTLATLLSGKSITGALLLGYVAVEWAKRYLGYRSATGDLFAWAVPAGVAAGRVGCILQGCCQGIVCNGPHLWTVASADAMGRVTFRWPAAELELCFQCLFLLWVAMAARRGWCRTNRFHVYLIAYGLFRFAHEWMRDDARLVGRFGVYHVFALALVALGLARYRKRAPVVGVKVATGS